MTDQDDHRQALFDQWALTYDAAVEAEDGFPFSGHNAVLAATVNLANPHPGDTVLDVGTGTGKLAQCFRDAGCTVTGIDHSPEMLRLAEMQVPNVEFLPVDLLGGWDAIAGRRFPIIASAYVFHEFDMDTKLTMIARFANDHLAPGGQIVIADIGFTTTDDRDAAHDRWRSAWDDDEHYWAADESPPA